MACGGRPALDGVLLVFKYSMRHGMWGIYLGAHAGQPREPRHEARSAQGRAERQQPVGRALPPSREARCLGVASAASRLPSSQRWCS